MLTVSLKKWGNSIGVRIPSTLLKEAHLEPGEVMEVTVNENGAILLTPSKSKQEVWLGKFNAIADVAQEGEAIDLSNQFDEDDWTW
jgi:antitoxin component of MazEF toxin-antitoxin module